MNKKCLEFHFTYAIQFSERWMRYNALVSLSSSVIAEEATRDIMFDLLCISWPRNTVFR